jgi:hypothetical protein
MQPALLDKPGRYGVSGANVVATVGAFEKTPNRIPKSSVFILFPVKLGLLSSVGLIFKLISQP